MLTITPGKREEVTKIACPGCGERLRGVGIPKGSRIDTLSFICRRCGAPWSVKADVKA